MLSYVYVRQRRNEYLSCTHLGNLLLRLVVHGTILLTGPCLDPINRWESNSENIRLLTALGWFEDKTEHRPGFAQGLVCRVVRLLYVDAVIDTAVLAVGPAGVLKGIVQCSLVLQSSSSRGAAAAGVLGFPRRYS